MYGTLPWAKPVSIRTFTSFVYFRVERTSKVVLKWLVLVLVLKWLVCVSFTYTFKSITIYSVYLIVTLSVTLRCYETILNYYGTFIDKKSPTKWINKRKDRMKIQLCPVLLRSVGVPFSPGLFSFVPLWSASVLSTSVRNLCLLLSSTNPTLRTSLTKSCSLYIVGLLILFPSQILQRLILFLENLILRSLLLLLLFVWSTNSRFRWGSS